MMFSAFAATPIAAMELFHNWAVQAQANTEAFERAFQGSVSYGIQTHQDLMQFALMRLKKNTETAKELATSRDRADLVRIASELHRTALEDYLSKVKDLADKSLQMVAESMRPLEERARASVAELPKAA